MLVDSHCHLNFPEYKDCLDEVIARAHEMDVQVMQTICTKLDEFEEIKAIAEAREGIYCSVGIHPHDAEAHQAITADKIIELVNHPKVIGIGETGLDYFYENSPKEDQQKCFREHIKAARQTGLPLIVHTRDADQETIAILNEELLQGDFTGLIHCFSAGDYLATEAMALGFYISVSGIVTFKKATEIQEVVKAIPLNRLLVETDAPFLAPVPHRGKTNEPGFTRHTAEFIAELKGISYEEVAEATTENFFKLFSKAKRP